MEMASSLPNSSGAARPVNKDLAVMHQMGKKQQLNRIFSFLPILALSTILLASWESVAAAFAAGLTNGGPSSLVYGMIISITGTLSLAISLAELASMCPISGAQYHWTYILAPHKHAAFITWMQGWITVFAWQATVTSVTYLAATMIQALAILDFPDYVPERWHGTLLMWAVVGVLFIANVWCIKLLPMIELVGGVCHIAFFFVLVIVLAAVARKSPTSFVFKDFENTGGWTDQGVSFCVSMLVVVYCFVGFDGAIHLSEEVQDATTTIPRIIILSVAINATLAFAFLIILLFCAGDIDTILSTPTGYPVIALFKEATGSVVAATFMQAAIVIIAFASGFALLASVSRLTWAFARDGGLPFSDFFAYVDPHHCVPVRALILVCLVVMLLSLINIGSTIALNAVLSLSTLALYISYLIPILLLIRKRLRGEPIAFGPFRLHRFGLWINLYAIAFDVFIVVFLPFPATTPVNATTMNYAGPVFGGLVLMALADWFIRGRRFYHGPVHEQTAESESAETGGLGSEVMKTAETG